MLTFIRKRTLFRMCPQGCESHGDCCFDAKEPGVCPGSGSPSSPPTFTPSPTTSTPSPTTSTNSPPASNSCANRCGSYSSSASCQCDVVRIWHRPKNKGGEGGGEDHILSDSTLLPVLTVLPHLDLFLQQCEGTGDCCADYKVVCLGDTPGTGDVSDPPVDTVVPKNCGKGEVTINGKCVKYEWSFASQVDYHQLPEPLAETSAAVVGHELVVFGDGDYLGYQNNPTSDNTKRTFVYNLKSRTWSSTRARRPYWGDHQSVEARPPASSVVWMPPTLFHTQSRCTSNAHTSPANLHRRTRGRSTSLPGFAVRNTAAGNATRFPRSKFTT